MTANVVAIADAVTAELNGNVFSIPFTAQRLYLPIFDIQSMSEIKVTVVPKGITTAMLDRTRNSFDYQIDIAVQKKTTNEVAAIDSLMRLVEEIGDYFRSHPLASYPAARWVGLENNPIYAPDHLQELRQFTSVLTLTFRLWR